METSLSKQLRAFQPPQKQKRSVRSSLLYAERAFNELDDAAVLSLARRGLEELTQLDNRFSFFEESLFGTRYAVSSVEVAKEDELKRIESDVKEYLQLLCPFFLKQSAQSTIDFLIRRYSIQKYSVDSLMRCALPYFSSISFKRLVDMLYISGTIWEFLEMGQPGGNVYARSLLVTKGAEDGRILSFVLNMVESYARRGDVPSVVSKFFSVVCAELVASPSGRSEDTVRNILEHLSSILLICKEHDLFDLHASCCLVTSELCVRERFSTRMSRSLINAFIFNCSSDFLSRTMIALAILCDSQGIKKLPQKGTIHIVQKYGRDVLQTWNSLVEQYSAESFSTIFATSIIEYGLSSESGLSYLLHSVSSVNLNNSLPALLSFMFKLYLKNHDTFSEVELESFSRVLNAFAEEYGDSFSEAVEKSMTSIDDKEKKKFLSFLSLASEDFVLLRPVGDKILGMALTDDDPSSRVNALEELSKVANDTSADVVKKHLLKALWSDNKKVVAASLSFPNVLSYLDPVDVEDLCVRLFDRSKDFGKGVLLKSLRVFGPESGNMPTCSALILSHCLDFSKRRRTLLKVLDVVVTQENVLAGLSMSKLHKLKDSVEVVMEVLRHVGNVMGKKFENQKGILTCTSLPSLCKVLLYNSILALWKKNGNVEDSLVVVKLLLDSFPLPIGVLHNFCNVKDMFSYEEMSFLRKVKLDDGECLRSLSMCTIVRHLHEFGLSTELNGVWDIASASLLNLLSFDLEDSHVMQTLKILLKNVVGPNFPVLLCDAASTDNVSWIMKSRCYQILQHALTTAMDIRTIQRVCEMLLPAMFSESFIMRKEPLSSLGKLSVVLKQKAEHFVFQCNTEDGTESKCETSEVGLLLDRFLREVVKSDGSLETLVNLFSSALSSSPRSCAEFIGFVCIHSVSPGTVALLRSLQQSASEARFEIFKPLVLKVLQNEDKDPSLRVISEIEASVLSTVPLLFDESSFMRWIGGDMQHFDFFCLMIRNTRGTADILLQSGISDLDALCISRLRQDLWKGLDHSYAIFLLHSILVCAGAGLPTLDSVPTWMNEITFDGVMIRDILEAFHSGKSIDTPLGDVIFDRNLVLSMLELCIGKQVLAAEEAIPALISTLSAFMGETETSTGVYFQDVLLGCMKNMTFHGTPSESVEQYISSDEVHLLLEYAKGTPHPHIRHQAIIVWAQLCSSCPSIVKAEDVSIALGLVGQTSKGKQFYDLLSGVISNLAFVEGRIGQDESITFLNNLLGAIISMGFSSEPFVWRVLFGSITRDHLFLLPLLGVRNCLLIDNHYLASSILNSISTILVDNYNLSEQLQFVEATLSVIKDVDKDSVLSTLGDENFCYCSQILVHWTREFVGGKVLVETDITVLEEMTDDSALWPIVLGFLECAADVVGRLRQLPVLPQICHAAMEEMSFAAISLVGAVKRSTPCILSLLSSEKSTSKWLALKLGGFQASHAERKEDKEKLLELLPAVIGVVNTKAQNAEYLLEDGLGTVLEFAKVCGYNRPTAFQNPLNTVLTLWHTDVNNASPKSLLKFADILVTLGVGGMSIATSFTKMLVEIIRNHKNEDSMELLIRSCIGTLEVLMSALGQFLSKQVVDVMLVLVECVVELDEELGVTAKDSLQAISSKQTDINVLKSAMRSYTQILEKAPEAAEIYLEVIGDILRNVEGQQIRSAINSLLPNLLLALDCRNSFTVGDSSSIENTATSTFVLFILKLNKKEWSRVLLRTLEWMNEESLEDASQSVNRSVTFFKLLRKTVDRLKELSLSFFVSCVPHIINIFDGFSSASESCVKLQENILLAVKEFFRVGDPKQVSSDADLQSLVSVIVSSVEYTRIETSVSYVAPCLSEMANTLDSEEFWKPLNHDLVSLARSKEADIRKSVLLILDSIYSRVGERYLVMLPETVQPLSELLEDESEEVVRLTRKLIKTVESLSGESIQQYF